MLAVSQKKLDVNDKYLKQLDDIKIRVPKGYKKVIQDFAKKMGHSGVNSFVISLINEKMREMNFEDKIPTGIKEVKQNSEMY